MSFDEDEPVKDSTEIEEYDWRNYGDYDQASSPDLDGRDIVAIFIAALQTIFLPLVILAVSMLIIGIAIGLIF
jgi:hypothetical protein